MDPFALDSRPVGMDDSLASVVDDGLGPQIFLVRPSRKAALSLSPYGALAQI